MTQNKSDGQRLPRVTPQLRRIEAGSAEALSKGVLNDGGAKGDTKS
jgi:hypothetical protein